MSSWILSNVALKAQVPVDPCQLFTVDHVVSTHFGSVDQEFLYVPVQYAGPVGRPAPAGSTHNKRSANANTKTSKETTDVDLSHCFEFQGGETYRVSNGYTFVASEDSVAPWKQAQQARQAQRKAQATAKSPQQQEQHRLSKASTIIQTNFDCAQEALNVEMMVLMVDTLNEVLMNPIAEGCVDPMYTSLWGPYTMERHAYMARTFERILDFFTADDFELYYDDSCEYLAYVYPTDPSQTIHLCPAHFDTPADVSYYSQTGTFLHEASHFQYVGDTDDHVYGTEDCEALALSNPCDAIDNADSYTLYFEQYDVNTYMTNCCTNDCSPAHCTACATSNNMCLEAYACTNVVFPDAIGNDESQVCRDPTWLYEPAFAGVTPPLSYSGPPGECCCLNSGTCVNGNDGTSCTCASGFEGDFCEINIDDCSSSPCLNGGTCEDGVDSYTCACADGFSGTHCEIDLCDPSLCLNGGSCSAEADSVTCTCATGFSGTNCEVEDVVNSASSYTDMFHQYLMASVVSFTVWAL